MNSLNLYDTRAVSRSTRILLIFLSSIFFSMQRRIGSKLSQRIRILCFIFHIYGEFIERTREKNISSWSKAWFPPSISISRGFNRGCGIFSTPIIRVRLTCRFSWSYLRKRIIVQSVYPNERNRITIYYEIQSTPTRVTRIVMQHHRFHTNGYQRSRTRIIDLWIFHSDSPARLSNRTHFMTPRHFIESFISTVHSFVFLRVKTRWNKSQYVNKSRFIPSLCMRNNVHGW